MAFTLPHVDTALLVEEFVTLKSATITPHLKKIHEGFSAQLNLGFEQGISVETLMKCRAQCMDGLLCAIWQYFGLHNNDFTLVAVGGFGRGELHPHSDIDLLILINENEPQTDKLESFLTLLWDVKLDIGHSVRTIKQCIELASDDISVITSLIESRVLYGNTQKFTELQSQITTDDMWQAQAFYGAKWEEQIIRHRKFGDTEYSLEPNIKDGPGGLRDAQTIKWLALRTFGTCDFDELIKIGILTEEEAGIIKDSFNYLYQVRWGLHLLAGREEDRLLFDYQRALAAKEGFTDDENQLAVERYMQAYYRHSMILSNMNEMVMQAFEESIWDTFSQSVPQPLNERFQVRDRHLEPTRDNIFIEQPSAILETFAILAERSNIIGTTVSCMRGIRSALHLIDDEFRAAPQNKVLFARLMNSSHKLATQLRRMNQQGILGRYLPEWNGIVGKMQHDLFHIYTVDAHTIQVIKNLRLLTYEGGLEKYPLATQVVKLLPELDLLYIAGLYHDIAKGRGGDHSELGAVDARDFCKRHGYEENDTQLVEFLVKNHLLMSSTSQRKDISDPDVIQEFALTVGNEDYLNYLFVLTVADINATNPNLWTSWRASLLRQLYTETRRSLRKGLEKQSNRQVWINATREAAFTLLQERHYTQKEIETAIENPGDEYFLRENATDIAWHTEAIINHNSGPLILIKDTDNRRFEGATQIFVYTHDTNNLFSRTTHILAQLNLNVQDARVYTNEQGYSLDTYIVLDADNTPIGNDSNQHQQILYSIAEGLNQSSNSSLLFNKRVPRKLQHFSYPAQIDYTIDDTKNCNIIEVIAPDRPGLLATVADVFTQYNLDLKNAKVSTLGERVEDVFFITDQNGKAITDSQQLDLLSTTLQDRLNNQNSQ